MEAIKNIIRRNPVMVGAVALTVGNFINDLVATNLGLATALESAVMFIVGFIQRSRVTPVTKGE